MNFSYMPLQNIPLDKFNLDRLHHVTVLPISSMFAKRIQGGVLNRDMLIKGLTNMTIHKEIENYFCFTELTLNNLNLENIEIIKDYISLKKLVLCHNSLQNLGVLKYLNELEYLDVSYNCLKQTSDFNPSNMLFYIDYSNNNIEQMDDLTNFWSLAHLDLSHNLIRHVNGLQELKYLTFLNLSHNCIKQISYSLPYTLVEINLSYNELEHIQLDMSSSLCEILNIAHNKLKQLDFLKNAKKLSVLNIQNNMIDDILQVENLKTLTNLRILNAENNKIIDTNIHKKIFSNNLPTKSTINQTFIKSENLQKFNNIETYTLLVARKSALKSTVLEHLSGRSPVIGGNYCVSSNNCCLRPMVILVGPPKTCKKYFLTQISKKHKDKFYQPFIYTTNNKCNNRIYKTILAEEFIKMNYSGELVFSYQYLGHSYGLSEDQISKCTSNNQILITFTNLEGALSLKLKGYSPIFILVLPENKLSYKNTVHQSIKKYMNHNSSVIENETMFQNKTVTTVLNETNKSKNSKPNHFTSKLYSVCDSFESNNSADRKIKIISHYRKDFNDSCAIFVNECMNNLEICYNLYENSTDIFHSLVYVDNFHNALLEITSIMIDAYIKYQTNQNLKTQKHLSEHTLKYIKARHEQLCKRFFE